MITPAGSQIQIVQAHENRVPCCRTVGEQFHDSHLVMQIQVIRRFVQQPGMRRLGHQGGNRDSLAFPARQGSDQTVFQVQDIQRFKSPLRHSQIVCPFHLPRRQPGMATDQRGFHYRCREAVLPVLEHQPQLLREHTAFYSGYRNIIKIQSTSARRPKACERMQQSGLAGTVGPEHAPDLTGADG